MNPMVLVVPLLIVGSGIVCFFVLPISLGFRLLVLTTDLVFAVILGFVLWRRSR